MIDDKLFIMIVVALFIFAGIMIVVMILNSIHKIMDRFKPLPKEDPKLLNKKQKNKLIINKEYGKAVIKSEIKANKILKKGLTNKKDLENDTFYYPARDIFQTFGYLKRFLEYRKRKKNPDKINLIRMEMNNGIHREFIIIADDKGRFKKGKKDYILDPDCKYYVADRDLWAYDFHESLAIPVKREIPIKNIQASLDTGKVSEVHTAFNPSVLERFIKSEIAQQILQGSALNRLFKVMLIIVVIIVLVIFVDLIVDLYDSGALDTLAKGFKK